MTESGSNLTVAGVVSATSFTGEGTVVYSNSGTATNAGAGTFTPIPANTLTAGFTYVISFQVSGNNGARVGAGAFVWRLVTGVTQGVTQASTTNIALSSNINGVTSGVFGDTNGAVTIQTSGFDLGDNPSWSVQVRRA